MRSVVTPNAAVGNAYDADKARGHKQDWPNSDLSILDSKPPRFGYLLDEDSNPNWHYRDTKQRYQHDRTKADQRDDVEQPAGLALQGDR